MYCVLRLRCSRVRPPEIVRDDAVDLRGIAVVRNALERYYAHSEVYVVCRRGRRARVQKQQAGSADDTGHLATTDAVNSDHGRSFRAMSNAALISDATAAA